MGQVFGDQNNRQNLAPTEEFYPRTLQKYRQNVKDGIVVSRVPPVFA